MTMFAVATVTAGRPYRWRATVDCRKEVATMVSLWERRENDSRLHPISAEEFSAD